MPTASYLLLAPLVLALAVAQQAPPSQVHIAFSGADAQGNPNSFSVMWYTASDTSTSICRFGLASAGLLNQNASGHSTTYIPNNGFHHTVVLPALQPETEYLYQVGDASGGWSDIFKTKTAPARTDVPFALSIFGDMGWLGSAERPMVIDVAGLKKNWTAVPTRETLERLKNDGTIDFIWHLGDIGYMDDAFAHNPAKFLYEQTYNGYMQWLQNLTSVMPYMVAPGNHESECHDPSCLLDNKVAQALRNFTAYNHRWHMPSADSDGVLNMWYSFNYANVHFVALDTETDFPGAAEENKGDSGDPMLPAGHFAPNGTYLRWLEADLAKANASRALRPWIIAGGHRPFPEIQDTVGALFDKYGVDMYFCGHVHSYQRSYPTSLSRGPETFHNKNHYKNPQGTAHVVVGGAGCEEMPFVGATANLDDHGISPLGVPLGSEVGDVATNKVASGVLYVVNSTALHWQLISSVDGTILDDLWVTKD